VCVFPPDGIQDLWSRDSRLGLLTLSSGFRRPDSVEWIRCRPPQLHALQQSSCSCSSGVSGFLAGTSRWNVSLERAPRPSDVAPLNSRRRSGGRSFPNQKITMEDSKLSFAAGGSGRNLYWEAASRIRQKAAFLYTRALTISYPSVD
jgi:hypothetical protein